MKQVAGALLVAGIMGCGAAAPSGATRGAPPAVAAPAADLAPLPYALVPLPPEKDRGDDTNHHRVLRWPLAGKSKVEAVALGDLAAPSAATPARVAIDPRDPTIPLGPLRIPPGASSKIRVSWEIPQGTGVNDEAPFRVVWASSRGLARLPAPTREKGTLARDGFEIQVEPVAGARTAELTGVLDMVVCDVVTHSVCLPVRRTLTASFAVEAGAPPAAVSIPLPAAAAP